MTTTLERRVQRAEEHEGAAGDPYADVDCAIYLDWEGPETWDCRNVKTGEPVAVTPALKAAIVRRMAIEPPRVTVDWTPEAYDDNDA